MAHLLVAHSFAPFISDRSGDAGDSMHASASSFFGAPFSYAFGAATLGIASLGAISLGAAFSGTASFETSFFRWSSFGFYGRVHATDIYLSSASALHLPFFLFISLCCFFLKMGRHQYLCFTTLIVPRVNNFDYIPLGFLQVRYFFQQSTMHGRIQ